ncbi:MAG: heavy metal-binding domain-containing protein [Elusimicrobiales bacterium]|jgi:hypothetical protein
MKKILFTILVLGIAAGPAPAEAGKKAACPMAANNKKSALCPAGLKGVETVSRNTADGVEMVMTAKDKETIAKVQKLALSRYNAGGEAKADCPCRVEGARTEATATATGVKVAITGATPEMIKKIQQTAVKGNKPAAPAKQTAKYVCPMGCAASDKPGKCPECGMEMKERK